MQPSNDMPGALPALWRALKRGYQAEPLLLPVALGFSLLAALPDALMALWLKLLADGVSNGSRPLLLGAALGLGGWRPAAGSCASSVTGRNAGSGIG